MKHLLFISIYSLSFSLAVVSCLDSPWSIAHCETPFVQSHHHHHRTRSRAKRYVLRRKRWISNRMSWRLLRNHITEADVYIIRNTLHRAFNDWASISNVLFEEVQEGESDIKISFERGFHQDRYPFDGRDGIVAHAFYPRDGRLHFDADEEWTLNQSNGVNLYQTALHEIGHLMGLEHSNDPRAAMFASKRPYSPVFTLSDDDVRAARELFPYRESTTMASQASTTLVTADTPLTFITPLPAIISSTENSTKLPVDQSTIEPSIANGTSDGFERQRVPTSSEASQKDETKRSDPMTSEYSPIPVSPMNRRPVFRLSPVFSNANRRSNTLSTLKMRSMAKKERIRSYSMLTLIDESTNVKKTSFFAQQAEPSSLE